MESEANKSENPAVSNLLMSGRKDDKREWNEHVPRMDAQD